MISRMNDGKADVDRLWLNRFLGYSCNVTSLISQLMPHIRCRESCFTSLFGHNSNIAYSSLLILNPVTCHILPADSISNRDIHRIALEIWANAASQQLKVCSCDDNISLGCCGGNVNVVRDVLECVAEIWTSNQTEGLINRHGVGLPGPRNLLLRYPPNDPG